MGLKANELRINNLLMYSDDSTIFKVKAIHEFGIDCEDEIEETYMEYENFEPIPLTEEWKPKIVSWLSNDYKIEWKNNRINFYFNNGYIATCDYLHEYQNLHFALTNEELEIKM